MVASDDRYRAIGPNHVEYFASSAVPMPPPHIQTIWPFVSGRRKSDGQRVCPTNQRHYAVAVFAADALRLHQLQCQPPQRQCFSIRCHGRKTFALFAAETSRKRSHATQKPILEMAEARRGEFGVQRRIRSLASSCSRCPAVCTPDHSGQPRRHVP
jgi:hypothetical protein